MVPFSHSLRLGLLLVGALAAPAGQAQTAPATQTRTPSMQPPATVRDAVLDPAAPVPVLPYRSVFGSTPTGVETTETDWRRANADVGQFRRGHVDILQWEAQHGEKH